MLRWLKRRQRLPSPRHLDPLSPLDRMLSLWLCQAHEQNATAILFGMPRELPASVANDPDRLRDILSFDFADRTDRIIPESIASRHARETSSLLRSSVGWKIVPTWLRIDGTFQPAMSVDLSLLPWLLSILHERIVTLETVRDPSQPRRYIEYDSPDPAHRRLVEVEWWFDTDNTFRLEIINRLSIPAQPKSKP